MNRYIDQTPWGPGILTDEHPTASYGQPVFLPQNDSSKVIGPFLRTHEVARIMGVTRKTICRMTGLQPFLRIGAHKERRYLVTDVLAALDRMKTKML